MQFVRNTWYPIAFSRDVGRALVRRTVIGEDMALYRREDGGVAALEDSCPHRMMPLSMGKLIGDTVQCGYHGMTFDCSGRCVRIPGQSLLPAGAKVRAYPATEHLGLVWVWPGDPALADRAKLFQLPQYDDPRYTVSHGDSLEIRASYLSYLDNLIDPAHVSFVHLTTIGSSASEDVPVRNAQRGNTVIAWRWILDAPAVPVMAKFGQFKGNVDRWHYYHVHAPCVSWVDFGSCDTGTIAQDGDREQGVRLFSCHFLTPVNEHSLVDHWMQVRNFAVGDPAVSESLNAQYRLAYSEDKVLLEAIQREEDRRGTGGRRVKLALDAAAVRLHRLIDGMIAAEAPVPSVAPPQPA